MTLPLCDIGSATTHLQTTLWTWKYSILSNVKMMTQHNPRQGRRQHPKNQEPIRTPEVSSSPILNIQTWRESVQSRVSRNSLPAVDHSNHKEETNNHRSMVEVQPTNADCATWKNCMNVHVCSSGLSECAGCARVCKMGAPIFTLSAFKNL